ncbi:MAG TPA: L-aspartate oxidase [Candidatus Ozemobacteraceae bacterium]|nr:L-aspartate oxidase [Candidatus Ozemobacteraceae bacterium]HQG27820.1 L-aspartate oxidase [Candidatus Ozemobacteraceae bacterium]
MNNIERHSTDVAIIGSGLAGLFAALTTAESASVTVLTRQDIKASNSWFAQGGIAAVWDHADSADDHAADTFVAGAGLCDPAAVRVLVTEGPDRVRDLIEFGARFDAADSGQLLLTREGAHGRRRILHAHGDATGRELERTLIDRVKTHPRIRCLENFHAADLVLNADGTRVTGIRGFDGPQRTPVEFQARSVILACGGLGRLYPETTNAEQATGDGVAIAWAAGARLADMEFVQFHPTVFAAPGHPRFLVSEAVRGEGAVLVNKAGERFMKRYHPMADLAPRDIVARAVIAEMLAAGAEHVFLDARHLGAELLATRFPGIEAELGKAGYSLANDLIPIAPAAHYAMGGVWTDVDGRTSLGGLYAAGEVASTGVHGANRLASNSLLECLVFGKRAGQACLTDIARSITAPTTATEAGWDLGEAPAFPETQRILGRYLGVLRTPEGLAAAAESLGARLGRRRPANWWEMSDEDLSRRNAATVGGIMAVFAAARTESRGAHFRTDLPQPDPAWMCRQFLTGLTLTRSPVGAPASIK